MKNVYQKVENDSVFACKNKQKLSSMSAATADSDQKWDPTIFTVKSIEELDYYRHL